MNKNSFITSRFRCYSEASNYLKKLYEDNRKRFNLKHSVNKYKLQYMDTDDEYKLSITDLQNNCTASYHASKKSNEVWSNFEVNGSESGIEKPNDPSKWRDFLDSDLDPNSKAFSDKFDRMAWDLVTER